MQNKKSIHDFYIGILAKSSSLAALSSIKMATSLGQLVIASAVEMNDLPSRVYNLDLTEWSLAKINIISLMEDSKKPLVGFTLVAGNVDDSLRLAKWFKAKGADIVLGGPEITSVNMSYYLSFSFVDEVVLGAGEKIIPQIMKNGFGAYSSLEVGNTELDFCSLRVNYELLFRLKEDHSGVSYVWAGDCHLRNNRCFFCARQKKGFGFRDPAAVWEELSIPLEAGKKYYYNSADSIAVSSHEFERFVKNRPTKFANTIHKCFINSVQVTDQTAGLLHELNGLAAIGVESLSNLSGAGKGNTVNDDNHRAIKIFAEHKVQMVLTFVLGMPGETKESLKKNEEELLKIVEKYGDGIFMITVSPLLITIGSRAFDSLIQEYGLPENAGNALYDPLALSRLYCQQFNGVERNDLIASIQNIHQKVREINPNIEFDSKGIGIEERNFIQTE